MRIGDKINLAADQANKMAEGKKADAKKTEQKPLEQPTTATIAKDIVVLSKSSTKVSDITERIRSAPEQRDELINELKAKIQSGSYNVSSKDIADKIVRNVAEGLF